jgi:protein-S-isoprenylcysteine O-methyltransferase
MQTLFFNIIEGCWITFAVVWVLAAATTKRSIYRESSRRRLRYWLLLLTGYLLLAKGHKCPYPFNAVVVPHTEASAGIGALLCLAGLLFCLWARITLGRNWSGTITLKQEHELIERGPYQLVRHPIYTGLLAMCLGTAVAIGHVAGFVGLFLIFVSFWIKLTDEEKLMLQHFATQYAAYQLRVKRIIPFML